MKTLRLIHKNKKIVVLENLRVAESFFQRFRGLMGKTLDESEGLLLIPCNSIHCFFMKIPIDVLFLDNENQVVHKIEGMKPWRLSPIIRKAVSVVEGPAGAFATILPGDWVEME